MSYLKDIQHNHFFFDGYKIAEKNLNNVGKIHLFLNNINKLFLKGTGKIVLIPYFNGKVKADGGISGIIIGNKFHFTCHTFCYKGTVFIDFFGSKDDKQKEDMKEMIIDTFQTNDYDLCNHNENIKGNFGKHIIVRPSNMISFKESTALVSMILKEIDMTPINDLIVNYNNEKQFDILQPIAESHISFHRDNQEMVIDAFSCKYFNEKQLLELLKDTSNYTEINRGIRFK